MKVRINSGGREVEIEAGETGITVRELADLAEEKWRTTDARPPHVGLGFSAALELQENREGTS